MRHTINSKTDADALFKLRRARKRIKSLNKKLRERAAAPNTKSNAALHVMPAKHATAHTKTLTEAVFDAVVDYMKEEVKGDIRRAA